MVYYGAKLNSHLIKYKNHMLSFQFTDEELPDYIMIMVANKRSREQMEEDLQLFLGLNAAEFTNWLHQVLQKLQEVTVASMGKS